MHIALIATIACCAQPFNTRYQVNDLGTLPSTPICVCFDAFLIADDGSVAGLYFDTDSKHSAFLHDGQTMFDIGDLGADHAVPRGISSNGFITGFSDTTGPAQRAFLYDGNSMVDIGSLSTSHSAGNGVNDLGHVVGTAQNTQGNSRAFLFRNNAMQDLGTFGGEFSESLDINNSDMVTGWAWDANRNRKAFLWSDANGLVDLGTLGGPSSAGHAINDLGHVVGVSDPAVFEPGLGFQVRAFLYKNGVMGDLGLHPLFGTETEVGPGFTALRPFAINNGSVIVGEASPADPIDQGSPWISHPQLNDGAITVLQDLVINSDMELIGVGDINNTGQIAATGRLPGQTSGFRALRLDPVEICLADFNTNESVDSTDFFDFLAAFFAGDADLDTNGITDSNDLFTFLDAFFSGC